MPRGDAAALRARFSRLSRVVAGDVAGVPLFDLTI